MSNNGLWSLRKVWNDASSIRNVNNLSDFTLKIKSWIPDGRPLALAYIN